MKTEYDGVVLTCLGPKSFASNDPGAESAASTAARGDKHADVDVDVGLLIPAATSAEECSKPSIQYTCRVPNPATLAGNTATRPA